MVYAFINSLVVLNCLPHSPNKKKKNSLPKRNEIFSHEKQTWRIFKNILLRENLLQKGCIRFDSNYMTFQTQQNCSDRDKISGRQGFGGGKDEQAEHRILRAVKPFCLIMADACRYTFFKTHRTYKNELSCKLSALVMIMYQWSLL